MNQFIKQVIEEKFVSKKQHKFFFAKANEKGVSKKEKKKWGEWAKEFSDKTDFKKLPEKVEKETEMDEIVDADGNIASSDKPTNLATKGVTVKDTTDDYVQSYMYTIGTFGAFGPASKNISQLKYWAEGVELTKKDMLEIAMNKSLGYDETMGVDADYEDAEEHFKDDLGLPDDEADERLEKMGYDEKLKDTDKVRLVENPKKFVEEYLESIMSKRTKVNDVLEKDEETKMSPIIRRQIKVLLNTLKDNGISPSVILKHTEDNE
jgi:hypothetical protein